MKKYIFLISGLLFLTISFVNAADTQIDLNFDEPIISENKIISNFITTQQVPGEPLIPFYGAKILLPYGEEIVDINVSHSSWKPIAFDTYIDFARTPQPTSVKEIIQTQRNEAIYESKAPYPLTEYTHISSEMYKGYSIALINIFPIRYIPGTGTVEYSSNWSLKIQTSFNGKLADYQSRMLQNSNKVHIELDRMVDNSYEKHSYQGQESLPSYKDNIIDPADPHDYIIVTSQNFVSQFTDFKNWKNNQGSSAEIYTIEDIYSNYSGNSQREKIRNFIILAYDLWSASDTPLEYVLLGGDDEIIPSVNFFVQAGGTTGYIPSDLYYGGLDGNWNDDGDNRLGEMEDNPDFFPEVAVGRIPGDLAQDFVNAINKIKDYTDIPKPSLEKACMVGENLNWNPVTWGGDYKDDVALRIPVDNYHFYTLYQREGTYSGNAVKNAINAGMGIINHMGHANYGILMGMNPNTPDSFVNDEYGFIYTQGCYPAAFDEATSQSAECVGERLVIAERGPMAFIGNTRYGWYSPGSIEGPSQQFDRTFFDALFIEDIRALGKANDYSKVALASTVSNAWARWCYYELVLFGDPAAEIIITDGEFPYVEVNNIQILDDSGDNDGIINPGEEVQMIVEVQNLPGWQEANNVQVEMQCDSSFIIIQNSVFNCATISPGTLVDNSSNPFTFTVGSSCGYEDISFRLQITANQSTLYPFDKTYYDTFKVSLMQNNWPVYVGAEIKSSPIVIDFDNDGVDEIIAVDRLGKVYAFTPDAETKPGFPIELEEEVWASLAAGDVDNDNELEVVIATRNGTIYAIEHDGSELFSYEGCGQIITTPTLFDLNDDGFLETIVSCIDGMLYVIDHTGNNYGLFPYEFDAPLCSDVAVGDINEDDVIDMIVGLTNGKLYAIGSDATVLTGFPVQTESHIWSSPTIFNTNYVSFGNSSDKLYIVDHTGVIVHEEELPASLFSSPIAFQQYRGGNFNIGYSSLGGEIKLLTTDGITIDGWPVTMNNSSKTSPIAADINDDGYVEILASTFDGKIYCYDYDGSLLPEFPITNSTSVTSPITIHDIDQDGDYEIIAGSSSGISIWDYKKPHGSYHPWSIYRGNIQRTGNYAYNQTYAVEPQVPSQAFALHQNFPNPFAHSTMISYNPGTYHFEQAKVAVYNIKGQMVQELTFENGSHAIQWDGRDRSGNILSNGVYLYKLLTENFESGVKKLLLIR